MNSILIVVGVLLLLPQLGGLFLMIRLAGVRSNYHVYRFYNPACWFSLFYMLWFMLPQIVCLLPGHHIIGFEAESGSFRLQTGVAAQAYLLAFIGVTSLGIWLTSPMLPSRLDARALRLRKDKLKMTDQLFLSVCLAAGTLATAYLGTKLMSQGGMRSELVKTGQGKVLTSIAFFGNFAFSVVLARSIVQRQYVIALSVFVVFASAVFFTGSRGRLMWPLALAVVYVFSYDNKFNWKLVGGVTVVSVCILVFSDTLLQVFKDDREMRVAGLEELFTKRNFDGFANFCMISGFDEIPRTPKVAITGARGVFMYHYFPKIFQMGVGFGATFPGMSWIAGGVWGLLLLGLLYGATLGGINIIFRWLSDERLFWAYLFSMTWYCAIGGNLHESLDKMFVAASPGLLWWGFNAFLKRSHRVARVGQTVASSPRVRKV